MFFLIDVEMSDTRYFPVTCLIDFNKYDYYYAYGNTPPEDLLQSVTADVTEPEILLLGCGDIRSCLYTLWNNFDSRHSRHFKGVHFVVNDINSAVLARNIIFLYLCTKMPSDKEGIMKWVASFWSIWFCHELLPQHKQVLKDALSHLLEWSQSGESWSAEAKNPLRKLVNFVTPSTLAELHRIWQMWYNDDRPVEVTRTARKEFLNETEAKEFHHCTDTHLVRCFGTFKFGKLSSTDKKCMEGELNCHYLNGTAFAEDVFNVPTDKSRMANSTFFEKVDGTYNSHNAYPYRCFSHAFRFSLEYVKKFGYPVLVNDESFLDHPLLANSVQQFSVWVMSCARILSKPNCILFSFQCSDALDFCQGLCNKNSTSSNSVPHLFDAIYASNLIDYIALPSIVLVTMSALRQTGLLFTNTFRYTAISKGSRGYLYSLFGFDSKYLPLLCGIRCIGYDDEYSAELSVKPVSMIAETDVVHGVIDKQLIWQHVAVNPLKQITQNDFDNISKTLCDAVKHMLTSFMNGTKTAPIESLLCTETAVLLLQSFVSQLDSSEYHNADYKFWSPLSSLLVNQTCLKPFIMSLQTQSLLHGVHLHLTESELSCPLCIKRPLSDFVTQCSIEVQNIPFINEPRILILLHNLAPLDTVMLEVLSDIRSSCIDDVHVISSIAKRSMDEKISYEFFVPASFIKKDYHFTIISFTLRSEIRMIHDKLNNCKFTKVSYSFNQYVMCHHNPSDLDFGTWLQHSGNTSGFESIIILSNQCMHALEHHQITAPKCTTTKLKVVIDKHSIEISYPYPIVYNKVSIKLSRKNKRIMVAAFRKSHQLYEEEQPVYIVNPDNALVLPTLPVNEVQHYMTSYSGFQYSLKENTLMRGNNARSPLLNAKVTMATILQKEERNFFQLAYSGRPLSIEQMYRKCQCFVVIENRKFDLWNKSPVVDMWFCFLTPEKCKRIYQQWCNVYESESGGMTHFTPIDEEERQLLENIFNYFARRTASTSKKPTCRRYQLLVKQKIQQYFTRAVVYPLYPSYSMVGLGAMGMPKPFDQLADSVLHDLTTAKKPSPDQNKCSFCGNYSGNLKKCSRCHSVQYCNRECQKKHWSSHKSACFPLEQKQ